MRTLIVAVVVFAIPVFLPGCGGGPATEPEAPPEAQTETPLCPELGSRLPEPDLLERAESLLADRALDDAERVAVEHGCHLAPASIDGEPQPLTREYDPSRIQVEVRDDRVVEVLAFG